MSKVHICHDGYLSFNGGIFVVAWVVSVLLIIFIEMIFDGE